jgi:hypothetical protein
MFANKYEDYVPYPTKYRCRELNRTSHSFLCFFHCSSSCWEAGYELNEVLMHYAIPFEVLVKFFASVNTGFLCLLYLAGISTVEKLGIMNMVYRS